VTDPDLKQFIGERYRVAWYEYSAARAAQSAAAGNPALDASDTRVGQLPRLARSAQFLADHMGEVPAMVIPCIEGRPTGRADADAALYGSIVPATWSFMLAARARGLGTAYTTLHLRDEAEVADRLGIPYARYMQAALLPVGYYTGDQFQAATRIPADSVVRWNHW
jgi:nitroreductase